MMRNPNMVVDTCVVLPSSLIETPAFGTTADMCLAWLIASAAVRIPRPTGVELALLLAAAERFDLAAVGRFLGGISIDQLLPLLEPLESGRARVESAWRDLAAGADNGVVSAERFVLFHDIIRAVRLDHERAWRDVRAIVGDLDVTRHPFGL